MGGNCSSPVVISSHAHSTSDTHGQFGILAHEQEVGCLWILKMMELVIIEIFNKGAQRIRIALSRDAFVADDNHLVGADE